MSTKSSKKEGNPRVSGLINENLNLLDDLADHIIDTVHKGVLVIFEGEIIYSNSNAAAVLGYSAKELNGLDLGTVIVSSKGGQITKRIARTVNLKSKSTGNENVKLICKGGAIKWQKISFRRCLWRGRPSIILALTDILSDEATESKQNVASDRYKLALQVGNHFVWDYNLHTGDFFIDKEYFSKLGYSPIREEITFLLWQNTLDQESLKEFNRIIAELSAGKDSTTEEWEYKAIDSENRPRWLIADQKIVERDNFGKPLRVTGIHSYIDEKKRIEIEREKHQKILSEFFRNTFEGLVIIDEKGLIREWNTAQEKLTQIKRENAIGHYVWDLQKLLSPENRPVAEFILDFETLFSSIAHTASNPWAGKVVESKIKTRSQELRIVQHSIFAVKTQGGIMVAIINKDVTESKTSLAKLEKSEERLKLALAASNVGIWDIDFISGEKYFSPLTYTILGYRPLEVDPTEELWSKLIHPEDLVWVNPKVKSLMTTGNTLEMELRVKRKDGEQVWLHSKMRIIRDERNKNLRVTGTISDITRKKNIETDLRESEEKMKRNLQQHILVSEISYILNTNKPFSEKINVVLELLGVFTQASRVYVFESNLQKGITTNTYEWCNYAVSSQKSNLQEVPLTLIESWAQGKDCIMSRNLSVDLPADMAQMMVAQDIESFLIFRLQVGGKDFGFIGFDECEYRRIWIQTEIELLRTISNLVSFTYERELLQNYHLLNEQTFRELTDIIPQIIFEISPIGKIEFLNETGFKFFGINKSAIQKGLYVWSLFSQREVLRMRSLRDQAIEMRGKEPLRLEVFMTQNSDQPLIIYLRPRIEKGELVNFTGVALLPEGNGKG